MQNEAAPLSKAAFLHCRSWPVVNEKASEMLPLALTAANTASSTEDTPKTPKADARRLPLRTNDTACPHVETADPSAEMS